MSRDFSDKYLELLTGKYSSINLTRIEDADEFYHKQILDSVLPLEKSEVFKEAVNSVSNLVDIGFGGGFPILPLAHSLPNKKFYGFDARAKKASVVSQIAHDLNINNAKLSHARFEDIIFDLPVVITFKAVGKVEDLLEMFTATVDIKVFFFKGPNFYELENLEKVLEKWDLIEEVQYEVPGTEGRMLLGFKNKNVLRGTKNPQKIKFSSLL